MNIGTFATLGGSELVCADSLPIIWGIFDPSIAPPFLYYSYVPIIGIALLFGLFVYLVSRSTSGRLLVWIAIIFSLIAAGEIVLWIATPAALIHFVWQSVNLFHGVLAFLIIAFGHAFLVGKSLPLWMQWLALGMLVPVFVMAPTSINLTAFDLTNCESIPGPLNVYVHILQTLALAGTFYFALRIRRQSADSDERRKALIFGAAVVVFFGIYILSSMFADATLVYNLNLVGPLGMVGFLATIVYLIVKYHAFNMRVFGAQALVAVLIALIFSALFVRTIETSRIVVAGTLVLVTFLGILLIRSVRREIAQRERIEKLARELQETNERQEGLLHFIGHEVKGFLTKDAGAFASLVEGDIAPLPEALKDFVCQALKQSRDGARSVTDILTAANQKRGTVSYEKEPLDLEAVIKEQVEKQQSWAKERGLTLSFAADATGAPYTVAGDKAKLGDNVIRNIIENAIHYTPSGSVTATLKKENGTFIFAVQDTGIGLTPEDKERLFTEGGHGKDAQRINVHSTGYGLYIAKNIVEAHGGTIRAESEGYGKGSRFVVELPA